MSSLLVRVRRAGSVALLTLGVALLGACADAELSHEEYLEQADGICATANDELARLDAPDAADRDAVADAIDAVVEIQRGELEEIERLAPARDDRDLVREWLEGVRAALDDSAAAATALRDDDLTGAQRAMAEASAAAAMADERARALGLRACVVRGASGPATAPQGPSG